MEGGDERGRGKMRNGGRERVSVMMQTDKREL